MGFLLLDRSFQASSFSSSPACSPQATLLVIQPALSFFFFVLLYNTCLSRSGRLLPFFPNMIQPSFSSILFHWLQILTHITSKRSPKSPTHKHNAHKAARVLVPKPERFELSSFPSFDQMQGVGLMKGAEATRVVSSSLSEEPRL